MKPLVLAHRGASAYAPENTIAAFNLALEMGADGIELDVTLSKDGVPIVIHDDTVDRTTNGHGAIKEMTVAEIQQLDAHYQFDQYAGEKIPTLAQVLDAIGKRGIVNIELKSTTFKTDGLEIAVLAAIEDTRTTTNVIFSSFNPFALARMYDLNPRIPRGLLYSPGLPIYLRRAWLRPLAHATAMHPECSMITAQYVAWAKNHGLKVNAWTTDEPEEMQRLIELDVDAIMTNKPDVLVRVVNQGAK
jgi:glycerophosphoryl diester phosphodiesterase